MCLPLRVLVSTTLLAACPLPLAAQTGDGRPERTGPSIVSGRILDHETDRPVGSATVTLARDGEEGATESVTMITKPDGTFRFGDVTPGEYVLVVMGFGYRTFEDPLEVQPGSEIRLGVRLSVSPIQLAPLMVVTARRPPFMEGFEERRAEARRHTGFFTRAEIQERDPRDLAELFREVPGTRVSLQLFGPRLYVDGNPGLPRPCRPAVWVNGYMTEMMGFAWEDVYPPDDIAAVELYALAGDVPREFQGPNRCGAVVIWLRERGPDEQYPATWKRWLAALGLLSVTFILAR